ncbi:uncharacterized protein BDZ99DRAFT_450180 [Mytilinidion resinicola]|uniref:Metallo-beta-lactamase domain-containing protein n=1 Tax=Mytilinidion resinicola TaxID=574789 RepID=A0A6A6YAM3_9PEZI|nr:uncharacterized protein BDZ99DRAFT_450180 [Mytilinidion resinicola]KAF2805553.1 hypothetical protein BDZ99DRAFT_450180 [Mytilinidion resinicola]
MPLPPSNPSCPFSIRRINPITYLIRENDIYGEHPHIYAKICSSNTLSIIVLSDTGVGTNLPNPQYSPSSPQSSQPKFWNIGTFLEHTINPDSRIPYVVITTHCHYDHILGIHHLPPTDRPPTIVLASSNSTDFLSPYSRLQRHSLCDRLNRRAPWYHITWAVDLSYVTYKDPFGGLPLQTNIQILHAPGHTPDSLAWFDAETRLLCVGDSLYETESRDSRDTPWGEEPRAAVILVKESVLSDWWASLAKVVEFVKEKDTEVEDVEDVEEEEDMSGKVQDGIGSPPPQGLIFESIVDSDIGGEWRSIDVVPSPPKLKPSVLLCAGHVTVNADAAGCLLAMRDFMARILRDEVPRERLLDARGEETWFWDDLIDEGTDLAKAGRFSLVAPLRVIEEGRKVIPQEEWTLWCC